MTRLIIMTVKHFWLLFSVLKSPVLSLHWEVAQYYIIHLYTGINFTDFDEEIDDAEILSPMP